VLLLIVCSTATQTTNYLPNNTQKTENTRKISVMSVRHPTRTANSSICITEHKNTLELIFKAQPHTLRSHSGSRQQQCVSAIWEIGVGITETQQGERC